MTSILRSLVTPIKGLILLMLCAAPAMAGSSYSSASSEAQALIGTGRFTNLLIYATNQTATAGFLVILDQTTTLTTGAAIVPKECIALPANSTASIRYDVQPYVLFTNGVTVALTSASSCFTFTSGTITGFIKGYVQ